MVINSVVIMILQILFDRGQSRADLNKRETAKLNQSIFLMPLCYWTKRMLFWERDSIFALINK